jgi:hypothetical protein
MFKINILKRVLGAVQRLENAMKKRSKESYCGIKEVVLNVKDEFNIADHLFCIGLPNEDEECNMGVALLQERRCREKILNAD